MPGHPNRIDSSKLRPLLMSFREFHGMTRRLDKSRLADIGEENYRPKTKSEVVRHLCDNELIAVNGNDTFVLEGAPENMNQLEPGIGFGLTRGIDSLAFNRKITKGAFVKNYGRIFCRLLIYPFVQKTFDLKHRGDTACPTLGPHSRSRAVRPVTLKREEGIWESSVGMNCLRFSPGEECV